MLARIDPDLPGEWRKGPGLGFEIHDDLLTPSTEVILTRVAGPWLKVCPLASSPLEGSEAVRVGWIHVRSLAGRPYRNPRALRVPTVALPVVFAKEPIHKLGEFSRNRWHKVNIPKGSAFLGFAASSENTLVWLPQTQSVAWLPSGKIN